MQVFIVATLDTKGHEAAWVRDELARHGVSALLVDTGCMRPPAVPADIDRREIFHAAGTTAEALRQAGDRGAAVAAAAAGIAHLVPRWHRQGRLSGVLGLGGSAGTTIATAAMRALPLGVPKLMVSTLASGQVRHYVGDKDIFMLNAVVDILGVNRISRLVLGQAARAMAGLVRFEPPVADPATDRPLIAASMFGVTTPCVERAREVLAEAGYEVLVFHATGTGGAAMETLLADGLFSGVLDITTTELADELVGGVLSAGPDRLTAAGRLGVPQVVSVGALDMVNFHARDTVPAQFAGRTFYQHNATVTLMRTTADENAELGQIICQKLATARGPTAIVVPLAGVSAIDRPGQPFDDPFARAALFSSLRRHHGDVELLEIDAHINEPEFAEAAANKLLSLIGQVRPA